MNDEVEANPVSSEVQEPAKRSRLVTWLAIGFGCISVLSGAVVFRAGYTGYISVEPVYYGSGHIEDRRETIVLGAILIAALSASCGILLGLLAMTRHARRGAKRSIALSFAGAALMGVGTSRLSFVELEMPRGEPYVGMRTIVDAEREFFDGCLLNSDGQGPCDYATIDQLAKSFGILNKLSELGYDRNGYDFVLEVVLGDARTPPSYTCVAVQNPIIYPQVNYVRELCACGVLSYYADQTGVIRATTDGERPNANSQPWP